MKAFFPFVFVATLLYVLVNVSETEGQLSFNTKLGRSLYNVSTGNRLIKLEKLIRKLFSTVMFKDCHLNLYTIVPSADRFLELSDVVYNEH